ncbi:hypothetical protein RRG08_059247 [Elysia crispata]|uniref:Uncharacterized protein n=1 Tax=Elysia crispata TaxID=231223 RepID=A0AAE1CUQ4_9GAST|nr:hypothetical protein RRG08_059247 [Elysia crispata]
MSINSISTKTKYNVQHRSDLLMDEHVRNVRQSQFELQSALQELEGAKTQEEVTNLRIEIVELKNHSQRLVLALQVMEKINTELAYARADLKDALHKGVGDINAARKRVIWLEDKMGELCGKKRLKTRRPSNRFVTDPTYGWDTDSEGEQRRLRPLDSTERMYDNEARHQSLTQILGSEIGFTSDSENMIGRQVGFQDLSSQSYDSHSQQKIGQGGSQEDVCYSSRELLPLPVKAQDHRKALHDSITSLTSGGPGDIVEETASEKFSTVREASAVGDRASDGLPSPELGGASTPFSDHPKDRSGTVTSEIEKMNERQSSIDETNRHTREENVDQSQTQSLITIDAGRHDEDEEDDDDDEKRDKEEDEENELQKDEFENERGDQEKSDEEEPESEENTKSEDSDEDEKENVADAVIEEKNEEQTFITELNPSRCQDQSRELTKSTLVGKEEDISEVADAQRDAGKDYWQSEHHRFEYSRFADVFTDIDPMSYHQMGLAVPGSFIAQDDINKDFQDLPWRARRKGSDIKDIHRLALDKLAARVHGMYDKVFNATMLSVREGTQGQMPRETSLFHSVDSSHVKPGSSSSKGTVPQTAPASLRQKTEDKMPLPMSKDVKRGGTFVTKHLVFHPKPIPPPQVLPITRTSLNKEFPQWASSYSHPDPDSRQPAERLVHQGNLLEETKLVLYRDKVGASTPTPAKLERKFRKMIEKDGVASNKSSGKKARTGFKAAAIMAKFQNALSSWNDIKPQSRGNEYAGLRWERVKSIVHMNLKSERVGERIDAAKQLGALRSGDTMVFFALKDRLHNDPVDRVKYEAAKSLILVGCWEDEVVIHILKYLVLGNTEVRADLIQTLIHAKNVQYVDKTIPSVVELVKVLSHLCRNPDPEDLVAFNSAVCLGRLCVKDESAQARLIRAMEESKDTHLRAKAMEILVKQLHCTNDNVMNHVLKLMQDSPVWKYRALACRLLIALGPRHDFVVRRQDKIYKLLEFKLWDDPTMDVRLAAAKALTALGMFTRACDTVERKLEDNEEDARAQAAIAVGTLGMKSEKLIRLLLEMLELDSSDYVRLMIIRTFGTLKLTDQRVIRCLREREKLEGPLAREAHKSLRVLETVLASQPGKGAGHSSGRKYLHSRRVLSPILATAI